MKQTVYVEKRLPLLGLSNLPGMHVRNYVHLKSWEECRMINDPIVEEVRRYRKEHAARYGNDLNRIVEALKKRERESHRIRLNPGPKLLIKNKSKYSCESVPPVP